jgi:hypothetical protein
MHVGGKLMGLSYLSGQEGKHTRNQVDEKKNRFRVKASRRGLLYKIVHDEPDHVRTVYVNPFHLDNHRNGCYSVTNQFLAARGSSAFPADILHNLLYLFATSLKSIISS